MTSSKLSPIEQVDVFIRSRYPVVWIVSQEESRVEHAVLALLETSPKHAHKTRLTWTISKGVRMADAPGEQFGPEDPISALRFVSEFGVDDETPAGTPSVFLFKDLAPYLEDPRCVRALRDVIADVTPTQKTLIVISPVLAIPQECQRQVAVVEWGLPTVEELAALLDDFIADLNPGISTLNGGREEVAKALSGLTEFQASSVLATAVITTGKLDGDAVEFIIKEKARLIKESGLLEFYQPENLPEIGGLDLLKAYLARRRRTFSEAAREYGLTPPKGLLLVGVPGCGKSLACKTLAKLWNLPLIRLDIGALMGSLVGQSEQNLRQALRVAESAAPCAVWLDEIEKGLSGVKSSGTSDGGTTARVFGTLLTWLQEKTAPVYVIATSNDISALPPELLRAGRVDDIFWVGLPNATERREIWEIHIAKVGRDPVGFDIGALVDASNGYSGSEIETAVQEALYAAFDDSREVETADLVEAIAGRVPLTATMAEQIGEMEAWASRRAKPASSPSSATTKAAPKSRAARLDL